jgi:outer membrane protein OmpA-like peptidoglycan-associated protein
MTAIDERPGVGVGRLLAVGALTVIDVLLVVGILSNHGILPFGDEETVAGEGIDPVGSGEDASGDSAGDANPGDGTSVTDDGSSVGTSVGESDETAASDEVPEVDDWPGGHGPVPEGPPVERLGLFDETGALVLSGSVPSWAVATELVEIAGSRLEGGVDSIDNRLTWHPDATSRLEAGTVRLDPAVLYPLGETAIPDEATEGLDLVAQIVIANPTVFVVVIGHTDDLGDTEDNAAVAFARANGVVSYLTDQGANPAQIVIASAGEDQPAASNETEEGRTINRRIEIQFVNFLSPTQGNG